MRERTTWTTEDEIKFIDSLKRAMLRKYMRILVARRVWGEMDWKIVLKHLKERMG